MTDHAFVMTGESIPAICNDEKTQSRRLLKVDRLLVDVPREICDARGYMTNPGVLRPGRYRVGLNQHGAVFALKPKFGLKPGEFNFRNPMLGATETMLPTGGDDSKRHWTLIPKRPAMLYVQETYSLDALTVYPCPPAWYRSDFADAEDPAKGRHAHGCRHHCGVPEIGYCVQDRATKPRPNNECIACAMDGAKFRWKPSRFMPRRLSRLRLSVSMIRIQRLFDISEEDAKAEGVKAGWHGRWLDAEGVLTPPADQPPRPYLHGFMVRWKELNGDAAVWSNPWVWAYTFSRVR